MYLFVGLFRRCCWYFYKELHSSICILGTFAAIVMGLLFWSKYCTYIVSPEDTPPGTITAHVREEKDTSVRPQKIIIGIWGGVIQTYYYARDSPDTLWGVWGHTKGCWASCKAFPAVLLNCRSDPCCSLLLSRRIPGGVNEMQSPSMKSLIGIAPQQSILFRVMCHATISVWSLYWRGVLNPSIARDVGELMRWGSTESWHEIEIHISTYIGIQIFI